MKLNYRGASYDYMPNPVPKRGSTIGVGHYRGAAVEFYALAETPEQPSADLTWRGVPHHSGASAPSNINSNTDSETPASTAAAIETEAEKLNNGVVALARQLFIRRHQRSRRREQGMMVRLAEEVGISVDEAAHYESHIQGKLPHDFSGYDRSSTAMS